MRYQHLHKQKEMYPKLRRPHTLALDVDGVLLRHPVLNSIVADRAVSYVQKRVPFAATPENAREINRRLYCAHGHTWRGLRVEFGSVAGTLEQFNAWVYDDEVFQRMESLMQDPLILEQCRDAMALRQFSLDHSIPTVIFSNAPTQWCVCAVELLGLPCHSIIGSDHPVFMNRLVKPDGMLYANVTRHLERMFQMKEMKVYFVDDSLVNLFPLRYHPTWTPVWFQPPETGSASLMAVPSGVPRIRTMRELQGLIVPHSV